MLPKTQNCNALQDSPLRALDAARRKPCIPKRPVRFVLVRADNGDLQILEKPILRRPEPPKPEPTQEKPPIKSPERGTAAAVQTDTRKNTVVQPKGGYPGQNGKKQQRNQPSQNGALRNQGRPQKVQSQNEGRRAQNRGESQNLPRNSGQPGTKLPKNDLSQTRAAPTATASAASKSPQSVPSASITASAASTKSPEAIPSASHPASAASNNEANAQPFTPMERPAESIEKGPELIGRPKLVPKPALARPQPAAARPKPTDTSNRSDRASIALMQSSRRTPMANIQEKPQDLPLNALEEANDPASAEAVIRQTSIEEDTEAAEVKPKISADLSEDYRRNQATASAMTKIPSASPPAPRLDDSLQENKVSTPEKLEKAQDQPSSSFTVESTSSPQQSRDIPKAGLTQSNMTEKGEDDKAEVSNLRSDKEPALHKAQPADRPFAPPERKEEDEEVVSSLSVKEDSSRSQTEPANRAKENSSSSAQGTPVDTGTQSAEGSQPLVLGRPPQKLASPPPRLLRRQESVNMRRDPKRARRESPSLTEKSLTGGAQDRTQPRSPAARSGTPIDSAEPVDDSSPSSPDLDPTPPQDKQEQEQEAEEQEAAPLLSRPTLKPRNAKRDDMILKSVLESKPRVGPEQQPSRNRAPVDGTRAPRERTLTRSTTQKLGSDWAPQPEKNQFEVSRRRLRGSQSYQEDRARLEGAQQQLAKQDAQANEAGQQQIAEQDAQADEQPQDFKLNPAMAAEATSTPAVESPPESIMAKPTRRAAQPLTSARLVRRTSSDVGRQQAEQTSRESSQPRQPRQAAPAAPVQEAGKSSWSDRKKKPTKKYEKPDIEKLRQSRYDRRQQRQERNEAEALEQEEIFEVGSDGMSVQELATRLAINSGDVMKALFLKGIMVQVNQVLDKDMVKAVAEEHGVEVLDLEEAGLESMAQKKQSTDEADSAGSLVPRPPVVTVMGHVDHGKTSLLDFIRKTKIAAGEAGGITQAIGAYTCQVDSGEGQSQITFIDTPGHEAFTAMRARGAKVTDIAIIVVACDDGVRPQTREAISHAKAAKVPIIVALNKIDKDGASPERAKQEISEAGLLPEEWGGDTPMVEISAKKGLGIDDLLETVLLIAELEQLSANPSKAARGTVVEANMHPRMGPVATLLVAAGTLKEGNILHAGAAYGKVRALRDSANQTVTEAGPSVAVLVVGLNNIPTAGDEFTVMESEQEARKVASAIESSQRLARLDEQAGGTMVTGVSFATMDSDEGEGLQHLNMILKADASGSLEAVKASLLALPQDRVTLRFLMTSASPINSGDVQLANASQGQIVSFNQEPSEAIIAQSKRLGVPIKSYKVIYELIDDVRNLMEGRLSTVEERVPLGAAEVRAVFGSGSKKVAGCMVTEGILRKGCLAVVMRNRKQIFEGELASLRRVKENVTEMTQGNECGVGVVNFIDWREGDKINAVEVQFKRQTLEEASERELTSNLQSLDEEELELEVGRRR